MTAILVIDDEPAVCSVIKLLLGRERFTVVTCPDGQAALDILSSEDFAAALIDLGLEPVHGRHVIEAVRAARPALPIVAMSGVLLGNEDDDLPGLPAELQGLHRLPKPFKPQSLIALVRAIANPQPVQAEMPRVAEVAGGH
jgi:two-component system OmpR family response regulator